MRLELNSLFTLASTCFFAVFFILYIYWFLNVRNTKCPLCK